MSEDKLPSTYSDIIEAIYEAALRPSSYDDFAQVWEKRVVRPWAERGELALNGGPDLSGHFERALEMFNMAKQLRKQNVQSFLDQQNFAAAIALGSGSILASNANFDARFELQNGESLFDHIEMLHGLSNPEQRSSLIAIWQAAGERAITAQFHKADGTKNIVMIEALINHDFPDAPSGELLLVKCCHAEWSEYGANSLQISFALTPAEMIVAEHLYSGLHTKEIAKRRHSSTETVRKQIKSILSKAQLGSQGEFVAMVTGIMHVVETAPESMETSQRQLIDSNSFNATHIKSMRAGQQLQYSHYGHPEGKPILFLHGYLSSAKPPPFLVKEAAKRRLQIIAPCKPGVEASTPHNARFQPKAFLEGCFRILDALGFDQVPIAGHDMGGVHAIEAAALFPDRFTAVGLFDTGFPLISEDQYLLMPESTRRIFMTAWKSPELLYAPFAFAAEAFLSGGEGERNFMRGQFQISPHDTKLVENPEIYGLALKALSDFMRTPQQSVDELCYWTSDWTEHLEAVRSRIPLTFFQSAKHPWLPSEEIVKRCAGLPNVHGEILADTAELFIFDRPDAFCRSLRSLFDRAADNSDASKPSRLQ